ncbi:metalloregulator ArsR/SmtB family transcription factor [Paraconexibacter antarcticus]|uniref:Metalloregulator ArsR/SmtB family transcription factor n=1 Tax=Paraconexibacter antarcticus TaxID=2949664 RepID=A0ABY5E1S3_9ACTN|nr:metalloregulator ArsR/SmtB family transcription factor [Paraconexibacter antarcticus]
MGSRPWHTHDQLPSPDCQARTPEPWSSCRSPRRVRDVAALGTPSRLRILAYLHTAPASVGDLADAVGMEASAVSHQLRLLRHLGLVIGRRAGRHVVYELHDHHVAEFLAQAVGHVEHLRNSPREHAPVIRNGADT